jgi:hypothetical protein
MNKFKNHFGLYRALCGQNSFRVLVYPEIKPGKVTCMNCLRIAGKRFPSYSKNIFLAVVRKYGEDRTYDKYI